jgi:hypothetical protein
VVELQPLRPLRLGVGAVLVRLLGKLREERRMPTPDLVGVPRRGELLGRVLADRLEHQEAVVADRLDQARVYEGLETVEVRTGDVLGAREWERAREDGEAGEERLDGHIEEVVAPFDRRSQRALTLRGVASSAGQEREDGA